MDIRKPVITNLLLTSALLVGHSSSLIATELDYTYVEARYVLDGEIDDVDDYDGYSFAAVSTTFGSPTFSVPEPSTFVIMTAGPVDLGFANRKKK